MPTLVDPKLLRVTSAHCGYCETDLMRDPHAPDCAFVKAMRELLAKQSDHTNAN